MPRETLLLSVRPTFLERLIDGTKTVELRRVRPSVQAGQGVLLYGSSPTMALVASAKVSRIEAATPEGLWPRVREAAGMSRAEYLAYFAGAERASAIWLEQVRAFESPLPLRQMRQRWPWFRPPQSYCYVRATFEAAGAMRSLAPRWRD